MNHYETVYIIHPAIQEGRLNDIVSKFRSKIESHKGKFLYIENWGKKKLSYPIDKQKYGTYVMCQYSLDGGFVKDVSQDLELNSNILRYLVTKIEQEEIKEGSNTLDKIEENNSSKASAPKKETKVEEKVEVEEVKEEVKVEEVKVEEVKEEVKVEEVKAEEVKEEVKVEEVKAEEVKEEVKVEEVKAEEVKAEEVKEEVKVEEVKEEVNNTSDDKKNEDIVEESSGDEDNQETDDTEKEGVK